MAGAAGDEDFPGAHRAGRYRLSRRPRSAARQGAPTRTPSSRRRRRAPGPSRSALPARTAAAPHRRCRRAAPRRPAGVWSITCCSSTAPLLDRDRDHRRAAPARVEDRVDAHAALGPLDGERPREADDAGLARRIRGAPRHADRRAHDRGDVDDRAAPASSMRAPTARQQRKTPVRLTSRMRSQSSSGYDSVPPEAVDAGVVDQDRGRAEHGWWRRPPPRRPRRSSAHPCRTPAWAGPSDGGDALGT